MRRQKTYRGEFVYAQQLQFHQNPNLVLELTVISSPRPELGHAYSTMGLCPIVPYKSITTAKGSRTIAAVMQGGYAQRGARVGPQRPVQHHHLHHQQPARLRPGTLRSTRGGGRRNSRICDTPHPVCRSGATSHAAISLQAHSAGAGGPRS